MKPQFLKRSEFQSLINTLYSSGYEVVGPQQKQGTIVYDTLVLDSALPVGLVDEQSPGQYKLNKGDSSHWFGWANGPQGLKPLLFRPREKLWQAQQTDQGDIEFVAFEPEANPTAVIGVKACDLAALQLQDQHFLEGKFADNYYKARREQLFIVATNCTHSADTCFCTSTGDGPEARRGYDLSLTELGDGFVIKRGTDQGNSILEQLDTKPADNQQLSEARRRIDHAANEQKRTLPAGNLRNRLFSEFDNPRWEEVAEQCLSCGNCTAVCPTCFCHSEFEDVTLNLQQATHYRQWSSCFTAEHSYMHGIVIRDKTSTRYRQWLLHKLGTWHDQYGRSGCVGCGRCIAWCPAGIDITEEVKAVCGACHD